MPNWKKVIVSGSEASLLNLIVDNNVTASFFTGSFKGDGSQLTNLNVDDGLPDNNWDFNILIILQSMISKPHQLII